jgi:hypothetical protein
MCCWSEKLRVPSHFSGLSFTFRAGRARWLLFLLGIIRRGGHKEPGSPDFRLNRQMQASKGLASFLALNKKPRSIKAGLFESQLNKIVLS